MNNTSKLTTTLASVLCFCVLDAPIATANTAAEAKCVPMPDNSFFSELMGITFSPEQLEAYDVLEDYVSRQAEERFKDVQSRELLNTPPGLVMKPGASDRDAEVVTKAQDEMIARNVSPQDQIKQLTEKFGDVAEFSLPRGVIFNTDQLERKEQFRRETEQLMRDMLTPEQQNVYNANLARRAEIEACEKTQHQEFPSV